MSEGLAQGPYVAARVEFEPVTLWTQGTELTTVSPRPTLSHRAPILIDIFLCMW